MRLASTLLVLGLGVGCSAGSGASSTIPTVSPTQDASPTAGAGAGRVSQDCSAWSRLEPENKHSVARILLEEQYDAAGRTGSLNESVGVWARDISLACVAHPTQSLESVAAALFQAHPETYGGR